MAKGKYKQWITKEGLTALKMWAKLGLTDKDIATNMDINVSTLYEWKNKYTEIKESLTHAKAVADSIVENALYKRAVGFRYDEVTKENKYNGKKDKYELTITKVVTKMVVPDTTAQIFWLKNRKRLEWRDKQEIEQTGTYSGNVTILNDADEVKKYKENM